MPYIAHSAADGFTVIHAHTLNGTKFFTWGMSPEVGPTPCRAVYVTRG